MRDHEIIAPSSGATYTIRMLGSTIPPGHTVRANCFACGHKTLSVSRRDDGMLAYKCHRASCEVSGYVGDTGADAQEMLPKHRDWQYRGALYPLILDDLEFFSKRFGLDAKLLGIRATEQFDGGYAFPVWGRSGGQRGWVIRNGGWKGLPLSVACPRTKPGAPKSLSYIDPEQPGISWYWGSHKRPYAEVIVVEDQVSAMCLAQAGYLAAALLGTHMTQEMAAEIAQVPLRVIIALDADATANAFRMAKKWGMNWVGCTVAVLAQDLKDTPKTAFRKILGV